MARPPATLPLSGESAPGSRSITLPFIGRQAEIERIDRFWRRTPESDELRVMLVTGEAGIGKSRLVEALAPRIEAERGVVVQTRVFPDSETDLVHLLEGVLTSRHASLGRQITPGLHGVVDTIRRIARLRAVLLIIEDVHLLSIEGSARLGRILELLSAERIAVLLLARPLELACRPVIERYLEEHFSLRGLSLDDIEVIWKEATGSSPSPTMLDLVAADTLGNPLAIRSMLREVLADGHRGASVPDIHDGLVVRMHRSVDLLSEGLLTGTSAEGRIAAERLALLGEVFSREAAAVMIENSEERIAELINRGMLAVASIVPVAIIGIGESSFRDRYPDSRLPPLAFTHTLVHNSLLKHAPVDYLPLLSAIADGLPLYSHLPFIRLSLLPATVYIDFDLLYRVIRRFTNIIAKVHTSPDSSKALGYIRMASRIVEERIAGLVPDERCIINARLMHIHMNLLVQPESTVLVDRMLEMTKDPRNEMLARVRITALSDGYFARSFTHPPEVGAEYLRQADALLEQFPGLSHSREYIELLGYHSNVEWFWNRAGFKHKSNALQKILADPATSPVLREFASDTLGCQLLLDVTSREQLVEREDFYRLKYPRVDSGIDEATTVDRLRFLQCTGRIDEAIDVSTVAFRVYTRTNRPNNAVLVNAIRLLSQASLGLGLDRVFEEICAYQKIDPCDQEQWCYAALLPDLFRCGVMSDWSGWANPELPAAYATTTEGRNRFETYTHVCLARDDGELERAVIPGSNKGLGSESIELLGAVLRAEPGADLAVAVAAAVGVLAAPTVRIDQLPLCRAVLKLVDLLRSRIPDATDWSLFDPLAHDLAIDELEWLAERRIPAFMPPLLALLERHGTSNEVMAWSVRHERIRNGRAEEMRPPQETTHLKVTMLDTITTRTTGAEPARVRGLRLQAVLATMVADRMISRPLTQSEFWRIGAGGEIDSEKARNVTNMTVHRLRELLGEDAIVTQPAGAAQGGIPPRLNVELVEVDILDASRTITEAQQASRAGALMRAVPLMRKALEISRGRVPFPGLYDDFFEALRSDFECRMRDATMEIARALLREEDPGGAEAILRTAFETMPDDEEIAKLLGSTLVLLDNRTEAERVRIRVG